MMLISTFEKSVFFHLSPPHPQNIGLTFRSCWSLATSLSLSVTPQGASCVSWDASFTRSTSSISIICLRASENGLKPWATILYVPPSSAFSSFSSLTAVSVNWHRQLNKQFGEEWARLTWDFLFDSEGSLTFKKELWNDVRKVICPKSSIRSAVPLILRNHDIERLGTRNADV